MPSQGHLFWALMPIWISLAGIGWLVWRWVKASDEPIVLLIRLAITVVVMGFTFRTAALAKDEASKIIALLIGCIAGLIMTFTWRQKFCDFVGDLFASLYTGGNQPVEPTPFYSIANAQRKQGRYADAIERVREQLLRFPTDFQGWMLIAEIQAENLQDLAAASETIQTILSQEGHAPKNIAFALSREADWCLSLGRDREAARASLERIVQLLPDTEQAQAALQRIAHLTPQEMIDAEVNRPRVTLQARAGESMGLQERVPDIRPAEETPEAAAGRLVAHLAEHPYDDDAREKLALVYARHYGRLDLATDQLEQLITSPNQPPKQVAHWLNLLADLQLELSGDEGGARATLQRVADLYPKTAVAENALNRMAYLKLEVRAKQQSQAIKLGSYEQNIGLKSRS
jgi:tetratricopeptide (TPR) repeat protein